MRKVPANAILEPVTIRSDPLRWSELMTVTDKLERIAREYELPVGRGNRLDLYRRLICGLYDSKVDGIPAPEEPAMRRLLCAGLELRSLRFILAQLGSKAKWRPRLAELFGGNEHPRDDRNPNARSRQSELFLAARLAWMGLQVEPAEPDIVAHWGSWRFAVAVKRIRSAQQYRRRLDEGFEQIRKAKLPGVVGIDLTHLLWFDQKPLYVHPSDGLPAATLAMMQEFMYDHHASPLTLRRGDLPFGAIYFATTAAQALPEGGGVFCTNHFFLALCEPNDPRGHRMLELNRLVHRRSQEGGDTVTAIPMR